MTSRQIICEIIKAIKNDDKIKIKKFRKEYLKTGYILSDRDMKNLHKKHSKSKRKSIKRKSMRRKYNEKKVQ